jgi:hypothetical protein
MKNVVWAVVGAAVGAGLMWLALNGAVTELCEPNSNDVQLSLQNKVPVAIPDPACVEYPDSAPKGGRVIWTAVGNPGESVVIRFTNRDPFENPPPQYTMIIGGTGSSSPQPTGQAIQRPPASSAYQDWKYEITWYDAGNNLIGKADPMIRIRH